MDRKSKQPFLQRRHADGQQAHKRCLTLLIITEMQIKTTMRYYLTPIRMASLKSLQTINTEEDVLKGNPPTLLVEM